MNQRLYRPSFHPRQRELGENALYTFAFSVIPVLELTAPLLSQTGGGPPSQSQVSGNTIAPFRRNVTRLVMPTQVHHSGKYYLHRLPPRHNRTGPEIVADRAAANLELNPTDRMGRLFEPHSLPGRSHHRTHPPGCG